MNPFFDSAPLSANDPSLYSDGTDGSSGLGDSPLINNDCSESEVQRLQIKKKHTNSLLATSLRLSVNIGDICIHLSEECSYIRLCNVLAMFESTII